MTGMNRALWVAFALLLAPCARERQARSGTVLVHGEDASGDVRSVRDASADVLITSEAVTPPPGLAGVIEAVRREDWSAAHDRLVRLTDAEQRSREGRYLGGRIALAQQDFARAADLLHGLGNEIPALATQIARLEASALSRGGHHAEARALYGEIAAHTHAERDRAEQAIEALLLGDAQSAAAVMRTWAEDPPPSIDRATAWRHAALALEAVGARDAAVRAWKRIVIDEPDASQLADARAGLVRDGATLSTDETLARAAHLNERARYTDTIAELTALTGGSASEQTRKLHLLGHAYYYARAHYADAQRFLLAATVREAGPERDEDAFLAARALSRSDRDDDAIAAYDAVAQSAHSHFGDDAAFRAIWLAAHHERVADTIARATAFLHDRADATPQLRSEVAWEEAWLLFNVNRAADAIPVFEQSASIATHALERGRGRYWAAMARDRTGDHDGAVRGFQAIIADRPLTWYALLAESRLREHNVTVPPPAPPAPRRPAPALPLPDDVRWLRALGFEREGGALLVAEEDALRNHLPHDRADEVLALAYLDLGEEYRAYTIAQRHNDLLDHEPTPETRWAWDCAYPRPYAHWVEAAEDANHLPRQYLYAIMRQESAFNTHDVSNARAIGLLQMIPPTTRHVAEELHIPYREELLFEPEFNIRTAGYYIGRLFAQYHGVLPRAIGAFNAGPNAMGRWVQRWGSAPIDEFVERIPYDETRTYVRRVTQNFARYRYLNGGTLLELPIAGDAPVENLVSY